MKILFIGGTGLISSAVTELALLQGYEVFLLNRGSKRNFEEKGARYIISDINDTDGVISSVRGVEFDAVVNWIAYTPAEIERDFSIFSNRTRQYIFISSASAYKKPLQNYYIDESTPLGNPFWDYAQQKADSESALFSHYEKDGFPATVVRPSHTYGDAKMLVPLSGAKTYYTYAERMLSGKPTVVHGDGKSLWTVTHNTDFAKAFVGLLGNFSAIGHAFHITSDEALTWDNIMSIQAEILGVEPNLIHIPSDFIGSVFPEYRGPLLGDKAESVVFNTAKIKRFVPSFICTTPFSLGARMAIEKLLAGERSVDDEYNRKMDYLISKYLPNGG